MARDAFTASGTDGRVALEALQLDAPGSVIGRVCERVAFYRMRLDESGVSPEDIRSLRYPASSAPFRFACGERSASE